MIRLPNYECVSGFLQKEDKLTCLLSFKIVIFQYHSLGVKICGLIDLMHIFQHITYINSGILFFTNC